MNREAHRLVTSDDWSAWRKAQDSCEFAADEAKLVLGFIRARAARNQRTTRATLREALAAYKSELLSDDPSVSLSVARLVDELVAFRLAPLVEHGFVEVEGVGEWRIAGRLRLTGRGERIAAALLGRVVNDEVRLCCLPQEAPDLLIVSCFDREHETTERSVPVRW